MVTAIHCQGKHRAFQNLSKAQGFPDSKDGRYFFGFLFKEITFFIIKFNCLIFSDIKLSLQNNTGNLNSNSSGYLLLKKITVVTTS